MEKVRELNVNKTIDNTDTFFVYDKNDFDFELKFSLLNKNQIKIVKECGGYAESSGFIGDNDYVSFKNEKDAQMCCNLLNFS
jgi:hypothetical protein